MMGKKSQWALANKKTESSPGVRLRSQLHRRGLRFRKNLLIQVPGLSVRPDIVFPRARLAVFVDGCFWHSCPDHGGAPSRNLEYWQPKLKRNRERDVLVTDRLMAAGWRVVRLWEHTDPAEAAAVVAACVEEAMRELTATAPYGKGET